MSSAATEIDAGVDTAALLDELRATGVHMLPIPTPFAIGTVNCYLIEDSPLTLIDPGPNSVEAMESLDEQLAAIGHSIESIELILVTHHHIDHLGLVDLVARRSGAEVACLDKCVTRVENYQAEAGADDRFGREMMLRHGISKDVASALYTVSRAYRGWGAAAKVDRALHDGETLALRDRRLEVFHRPGHSTTDTIFWDADAKLLIAADHLIKHVSSNPLMARPETPGDPRPRSLLNYLDSLRRTREIPATLTLSGHGEPIADHIGLIDGQLAFRAERTEKLFALIAEEPRTAHELARATWGNIAVTQAFLTLSEVIGHTDILLDQGRIEEFEDNGVVNFRVAG